VFFDIRYSYDRRGRKEGRKGGRRKGKEREYDREGHGASKGLRI